MRIKTEDVAQIINVAMSILIKILQSSSANASGVKEDALMAVSTVVEG